MAVVQTYFTLIFSVHTLIFLPFWLMNNEGVQCWKIIRLKTALTKLQFTKSILIRHALWELKQTPDGLSYEKSIQNIGTIELLNFSERYRIIQINLSGMMDYRMNPTKWNSSKMYKLIPTKFRKRPFQLYQFLNGTDILFDLNNLTINRGTNH